MTSASLPLPVLALALSGCVLQGGAYAGGTLYGDDTHARASYGGQLQSRFAFGGAGLLFHAGTELEGRAEHDFGSLALWAAQTGVVFWPESSVSLAPYLHIGSPAGWSSPVSGAYYGASLEMPIRLYARTDPTEINKNYRFVDSEGALVPFVRFRRYALAIDGADLEPGYELAAGIAVRTEIVTDIIDLRHLF